MAVFGARSAPADPYATLLPPNPTREVPSNKAVAYATARIDVLYENFNEAPTDFGEEPGKEAIRPSATSTDLGDIYLDTQRLHART